jgi:hypothetical protein
MKATIECAKDKQTQKPLNSLDFTKNRLGFCGLLDPFVMSRTYDSILKIISFPILNVKPFNSSEFAFVMGY